MKGIFIPEITVEMFRNGCLESIETLMTEGEIYDIEYDPKSAEPDAPDISVGKWIPVSDRPPEDSQTYMCTCLDGIGRRMVTPVKYQPREKAL